MRLSHDPDARITKTCHEEHACERRERLVFSICIEDGSEYNVVNTNCIEWYRLWRSKYYLAHYLYISAYKGGK